MLKLLYFTILYMVIFALAQIFPIGYNMVTKVTNQLLLLSSV